MKYNFFQTSPETFKNSAYKFNLRCGFDTFDSVNTLLDFLDSFEILGEIHNCQVRLYGDYSYRPEKSYDNIPITYDFDHQSLPFKSCQADFARYKKNSRYENNIHDTFARN